MIVTRTFPAGEGSQLVEKGFLAIVPVNKVKDNNVKGEQFDRLISES